MDSASSVPGTLFETLLRGAPRVVLIDEYSASDGDLFPYRVKTLHLAKLIGKRTWGGVVGIRDSLPFVDGGSLNRPEFAPYSIDGKEWPSSRPGPGRCQLRRPGPTGCRARQDIPTDWLFSGSQSGGPSARPHGPG